MNSQENLHVGHRQRMLKKLAEHPDYLSDHEILEILLYNFLPRKNTNDIAHRLIRQFGSLSKVLNATKKELMTVNGVGESVATGIILHNQLVKRLSVCPKPPKKNLNNLQKVLLDLKGIFEDFAKERSAIMFLDENYTLLTSLVYDSKYFTHVELNILEITNAIALNKPKFAILSHSHTSCDPTPSKDDDTSTVKINELLSIHGVQLIDHIIICKNANFSYYAENRLSQLKEKFSLSKFMNQVDSLSKKEFYE
ncbi:MAG: hypothetical protein E7369_02530 [Clostridiales bacterium]|nr:hypothetical protein [Clostridiales bacterium]